MKNAPMRFGGLSLHHNPSKLKITDSADMLYIRSQCAEPDSLLLGRRLKEISGEGELYGEDCVEQYNRLCELYIEGRRGVLVLPRMPAIYAYLKELRLIAEPEENIIGFAFTFIETKGEGSPVSAESEYIVTADGESLWDIAYAHGAGVDELVALNPHIRFIDELNRGERVRLC